MCLASSQRYRSTVRGRSFSRWLIHVAAQSFQLYPAPLRVGSLANSGLRFHQDEGSLRIGDPLEGIRPGSGPSVRAAHGQPVVAQAVRDRDRGARS
jgi:hypothetical protein